MIARVLGERTDTAIVAGARSFIPPDGSLDTGVLAILDQRPGSPPVSARTTLTTELSPAGRTVTVLRG